MYAKMIYINEDDAENKRGLRNGNKYVSLDGSRVMFIGNSFTYYGGCVEKDKADTAADNGYFRRIAAAMGEDITVTCFTYGGKYLSDLYEMLLKKHPCHPGVGNEYDRIYDQDYVILQQAGADRSNTYDMARSIMQLFPDSTKFCFYVTTHDVSRNLVSNLAADEKLQKEGKAKYIPLGQLAVDLWKGTVRVRDSVLTYDKNSFIVSQMTDSGKVDGWHPNYLTGYITALMVYYALTGRSAAGISNGFVSRGMEYYTHSASDFDKILSSENDTAEIGRLIEEYVDKYN